MGNDEQPHGGREAAASEGVIAAVESSGKAPRSRGRVVVVDDEPHLSFLVRVILEQAGYDVAEAPNGKVALRLIAAAAPQLVVTDRMMPVMNGSTLVARLRADPLTASLPIMMVSSNPDRTAAVDAFLDKPFAPDELLRVAEGLMCATDRGTSS